MEKFPSSLSQKLQQREADNALRVLPLPQGLIDFSSNDYLGFSRSESIYTKAQHYLESQIFSGNGATGSRLITGNHAIYSETETVIAAFHDAESALIFNSGYDANVGFFSSVPQRGDVVLYDEYAHASIRDGIRLCNAAAYKFPHNDTKALHWLLKRFREQGAGKEIYVVTESVFSMDGDSPDMERISGICIEFKARLVVDEAHALGVFGKTGEGLVEALGLQNNVFARIVTFGKSLGSHGAAVLGQAQLKRYLINFARSLIYTTALPPHSVALIQAAYNALHEPAALQALRALIQFFKGEVQKLGLHGFTESDSAIHCMIIPGNNNAKGAASYLQNKGFDVRAILSPTVPQGQERLRICLHSYNTHSEVTAMLSLLREYPGA